MFPRRAPFLESACIADTGRVAKERLAWAAAACAIAVPAYLFTSWHRGSFVPFIALAVAFVGSVLASFLPVRERWLWGLVVLLPVAYVAASLLLADDSYDGDPSGGRVVILTVLFAALVAGSSFVGVRLGRLAREER